MLPLHLIVAMANGRVIGKNGGLPWHLPEDLKHFKALTMGHAIVMGKTTWDSIGKPLPGRTSIVVTRQQGLPFPEGVLVAHSLEEAIARARAVDPEPFVIGGAQIYAAALPFATHLHVTLMDRDIEGDTYFPEWHEASFRETERRLGASPDVHYVTFERTTAS